MKNAATTHVKDQNSWSRSRRWCGGLVLCWALPFGLAWGADIQHVSTDASGAQADDNSYHSAITPNGRYVVFDSYASNLVAGDSNGIYDVFRKDLKTGDVMRVSTDALGAQGNSQSGNPAITPNGRYVVFSSSATNLVADDSNGTYDVFRKDLMTGAITRVSTDALGTQGNSGSYDPTITPDGRYVVFLSYASNLVEGDSNDTYDIFQKDLKTGAVTLVSANALGAQANADSHSPAITPDGRYVVFQSSADNLVADDSNGTYDIFRKDLKTGAITRVSTDALGAEGNYGSQSHGRLTPAITPDGRYVVFQSSADNLVAGDSNGITDVFRKDLETGAVTRVSSDALGAQANDHSYNPVITSNGRYVVFESFASNLVAGDSNGTYDIFLKDLKTGAVTRLSTDAQGTEANDDSHDPAITPNGRYVVFQSYASNLVEGDSNNTYDIFRYNAKGISFISQ